MESLYVIGIVSAVVVFIIVIIIIVVVILRKPEVELPAVELPAVELPALVPALMPFQQPVQQPVEQPVQPTITTKKPAKCPPDMRMGLDLFGVGFCYRQCEPDEDLDATGAFCTKRCPPGYEDNGLGGCRNDMFDPCPEGTEGLGAICFKKSRLSESTPAVCPPDMHQSGLFCYRSCEVDEEEIDGGIACRKKTCPPGYEDNGLAGCKNAMFDDCPEGTWGVGAVCFKNIRSAKAVPATCPPGTNLGDVNVDGLGFCYDNCGPDEERVLGGTTCRKKCPDGYSDTLGGVACATGWGCPSGTTWTAPWVCTKNFHLAGVKSLVDHGVCPPGYTKKGALCYENCKSTAAGDPYDEYTSDSITCSRICPPGTNDTGLGCTNSAFKACPPGTTGFGAFCGKSTHHLTPHSLIDVGQCPPGYNNVGGICYKNCEADEEQVGAFCRKRCPAGAKDTGLGCSNSAFKACPQGTTGFGAVCLKNVHALTPHSLIDVGVCDDGTKAQGGLCAG